jgi:UDP-3-O-acyl N-acetylglucosamine deacetylase
MHSLRNQRTIHAPAVVEGVGYWSGRDVRVEFHPAAPDAGVVFVRADLGSGARVPARVQNRVETPRRTTLAVGGARVEMIEHVMAALAGLQIDNCEVRVNEAEMPGMDGSALAFVEALDAAGVVEQPAFRPKLVIREVTRLGDGDAWIEIRPAAHGGLSARYRLDYGGDSAIGRQTLDLLVTPDSFRDELADSRTFILKSEADWLLKQGLGARISPRDLLIFGDEGPIDNPLRYPDECVRHKVLDLIGDLALAGCDVAGRVIAHRTGHRLNAELVKVLLTEGQLLEPRRRSA